MALTENPQTDSSSDIQVEELMKELRTVQDLIAEMETEAVIAEGENNREHQEVLTGLVVRLRAKFSENLEKLKQLMPDSPFLAEQNA